MHVKVYRAGVSRTILLRTCAGERAKSHLRAKKNAHEDVLAKRKEMVTEERSEITTAEIVFDEERKGEQEVLVRYVKPKPRGEHDPLCGAKFFFLRISSPRKFHSAEKQSFRAARKSSYFNSRRIISTLARRTLLSRGCSRDHRTRRDDGGSCV